VVLEALPYRKDDVTASYRPEYERLCGEHGYAVARVDLRGTGSSEGMAIDEYPASEQADLCQVIGWLAGQPWSTGSVGMYGTSYSGLRAVRWNHRKRARMCLPVSGGNPGVQVGEELVPPSG
jgi:putative CocE/NonD family hydrolase